MSPPREALVPFLERIAENTGDSMRDVEEHQIPFFRKSDVYDVFNREHYLLYIPSIPHRHTS